MLPFLCTYLWDIFLASMRTKAAMGWHVERPAAVTPRPFWLSPLHSGAHAVSRRARSETLSAAHAQQSRSSRCPHSAGTGPLDWLASATVASGDMDQYDGGCNANAIRVEHMEIEVWPPSKTVQYWGKEISLTSLHETEIQAKLKKAWAKYHQFRTELCDRKLGVQQRLRLFSSVVTQTLLHGSSSWTVTKEHETRLQSAEMKMMRGMFDKKRSNHHELTIEEYVEWRKKSAHHSHALMKRYEVKSWLELQRQRQWTFLLKTLEKDDNQWTILAMRATRVEGGQGRRQGRPNKGWTDSIIWFLGQQPPQPQ